MDMNNNDILIRIRYALEIKNTEMVEIFKLGGIELTKEEVLSLLVKSKDSCQKETDNTGDKDENEENTKFSNSMLEAFLNGLIIFKRGQQEPRTGQPENSAQSIVNNECINNVMLKKLKIALALTSEDMLNIFKIAGVSVTKGELGAIFRKEGHRNYQECGDRYARNFLKGLAIKYRE